MCAVCARVNLFFFFRQPVKTFFNFLAFARNSRPTETVHARACRIIHAQCIHVHAYYCDISPAQGFRQRVIDGLPALGSAYICLTRLPPPPITDHRLRRRRRRTDKKKKKGLVPGFFNYTSGILRHPSFSPPNTRGLGSGRKRCRGGRGASWWCYFNAIVRDHHWSAPTGGRRARVGLQSFNHSRYYYYYYYCARGGAAKFVTIPRPPIV